MSSYKFSLVLVLPQELSVCRTALSIKKITQPTAKGAETAGCPYRKTRIKLNFSHTLKKWILCQQNQNEILLKTYSNFENRED